MGTTDNRDYLTGLYNRKGIARQYQSFPKNGKAHIMFCDLDNFKSVNDIYGHAAGDQLLVGIAKILRECSPEAVAGRLGGDEFILALTGEQEKETLEETAQRIMRRVGENRKTDAVFSMISVSIGIVWNASAGEELQQILHKGDVAMYQAKHSGKNCYVFFDDLEDRLRQEELMESCAEDALKNGEFQIRFQPVLNMQSSRLERTMVCVRWERPDKSRWEQEDFRPLFERNGFIRKVDEYVFEKVCEKIGKLREELPKVSVQLTGILFLQDRIGEYLKGIMDAHGVSVSDMEIAISETAFSGRGNEQIIAAMRQMKDMGFSLAMIGFGSDFSGFRYLPELPIDMIRYDAGYLKENRKNSRGCQIIKTLVRLGKDLKLLVVADGISDQAEVVFFNSCGCDAASGSYYSEPLDEKEYEAYVKARTADRSRRFAFPFQNHLRSEDGELSGTIAGEGVRFAEGISDIWGGIYFPGGSAGQNVVRFPMRLFCNDSFTISLWIKPEAACYWGSVVYAEFLNGFVSIVPFASEGISIFRVYENGDLNGWHDVLCHSCDLDKWSFVAVTYDAFSGFMRYYINGQKAGYQVNVPIMYSCRQVLLGGDPFQNSYRGAVSAFTVFDGAKTEEEIAGLYESYCGEPGFRP